MTNALEAVALSKRYGSGTWALRGLDLAIPQGSIVGLVGPNGAGKSTLLKTWIGYERATSGKALLLGIDPWSGRRRALQLVAYLAQSPAFYRDLTVSDHLDYVMHYRGKSFNRGWATRRLSDVGISLGARAGTLSGGQTAQLGLAIAFGLRAEILLLDEPLAALDPLARHELIELLVSDTKESGATTVLSSHIVSDIEQACDRIIVLATGLVQIQGAVGEITAEHCVVPASAKVDSRMVVSKLANGRRLCRRPESADGRLRHPSPTLQEIVLGYLSAGRAAR